MLHLGDEIRWEYTFVEEVQVVAALGVFGSPVSTLHTSAVDGKATKLHSRVVTIFFSTMDPAARTNE